MDTILLFKKDLERYPTDSLRVLHRYLGLPAADEKDLIWLIAIHHAESNARGTMKGKVEWEEKVVTSERDVPRAEERGGLGDIEWTRLPFNNEVRICLYALLKQFNVWDIEEIEELLTTGELTTEQKADLRACLNLLSRKSTPSDRLRVNQFRDEYLARTRREKQEQQPVLFPENERRRLRTLRTVREKREQRERKQREREEQRRAVELARQIGKDLARSSTRRRYPNLLRFLGEQTQEQREQAQPVQLIQTQEQRERERREQAQREQEREQREKYLAQRRAQESDDDDDLYRQ